MRDCKIESQLSFAHNAINNALRNTNIKSALGEYGYDDTSIKSGRTLYEEAYTLHDIQTREYGQQLFVTDELIQARAEANITYTRHLKLVCIALRSFPEMIGSLGLNRKTSCSLFGWLDEVDNFYKGIFNSSLQVKKALDKYGLSKAKLRIGYEKMKTVERKLNEQLKKDGEAHKSTKKRDEAFDEMNAWVMDFVEIASIALESKPQYLEILGVDH